MKQLKEYRINGKRFRFNFERFNELFDEAVKCENIAVKELEVELAETVNLDESSIHAWRFKKNSPRDIEKVDAMADFFCVDRSELLLELVPEKEVESESIKQTNCSEEGLLRFKPPFTKQALAQEQFCQRFLHSNKIIADNVVLVYPNSDVEILLADITRERIRVLRPLNDYADAYIHLAQLSRLLDLKIEHSDIIEKKILALVVRDCCENNALRLSVKDLENYEKDIKLTAWDRMRLHVARKLEQLFCRLDALIGKRR